MGVTFVICREASVRVHRTKFQKREVRVFIRRLSRHLAFRS